MIANILIIIFLVCYAALFISVGIMAAIRVWKDMDKHPPKSHLANKPNTYEEQE